MYKITVCGTDDKRVLYAEEGEILSKVLIRNKIQTEHPCGGRGVCGKCAVIVNGEGVLSCRYEVKGDIDIKIPLYGQIATASVGDETNRITEKVCLCLDVGTTTLVLAIVSIDEKKIIKTVTRNNPQRAFASDVMSRIDYVSKNGVELLHKILIEEINSMIEELCEDNIDKLFVAGNTTMLHLFFGVSCHAMGYAPYKPEFLDAREIKAEKLGIRGVDTIASVEGISAFVGADIVAGLGYVGKNEDERYNLLIDLGTNAEIVLYSLRRLYCTAAAAGPCFEGVNISCGMSAVEGAVYSYTGEKCLVIGGGKPKGLCATGLIDTIAVLLDQKAIDESGFMEEGRFEIAENVALKGEDVRQFQLAKSAICSAILALMKKAQIEFEDIGRVFVSGGFSAKLSFDNAVKVGLLPEEFKGKAEAVNNSCLLGLIKYACGEKDLSFFLKNAEYVDLAKDEYFQDLFIENMMF